MNSNDNTPQEPELVKNSSRDYKSLSSILALIDAWNETSGVLENPTATIPEGELERALNRPGRWKSNSQPGGCSIP